MLSIIKDDHIKIKMFDFAINVYLQTLYQHNQLVITLTFNLLSL